MSSAACEQVSSDLARLDEHSLATAFQSFAHVAASLERSYGQLQTEVGRLRRALEQSNRDLTCSLEENQRMRERLHFTLECLPCGVVVIESDGSASMVNREAQKLLQSRAGEPLSETVRQLLEHANDSSGVELQFPSAGVEWVAIRRSSMELHHRADSIFIVQDITESKRFELDRERLRRQHALAQMSATLAHEIRNPLASMELFAGLLAGSDLSCDCRAWVEHLRAGLRILSTTVNNVLQFHTEPRLITAPVDIGQLLQSVRGFLEPLAQQAKVSLDLPQPQDRTNINIDRHRVEQVLLNLVINALQALPNGGTVSIAASALEKGRVCIEVSDDGPGIPGERLERIFEPGFSSRPSSPGLGLAVCKKIMEQHGGGIRVRSRIGEGTTFSLEFPGANA
jgi:signal transduction histidine kinase